MKDRKLRVKARKLRVKSQLLIILVMMVGGYFGYYIFSLNNQYVDAPIIQGSSAILVDASSGKTLVAQDADIAFPVASMSKIMTEYIVQEQIEKAAIQWDEPVAISQSANNIDPKGVKIQVVTGDVLTVRDLYSAMVISSANNATKALAELISGTEETFAQLMNEKARELGLSDKTHFVNSTGLPNPEGPDNQMTAEDVAELAYQLLRDFPEVVETTKLKQYELAFDGTILENSNDMLFPVNQDLYFEEVDGLKTGFTDAAGYCFTGTAKQGDKRLISVVMGAVSGEARFIETHKLLSFGFKTF